MKLLHRLENITVNSFCFSSMNNYREYRNYLQNFVERKKKKRKKLFGKNSEMTDSICEKTQI